MKVAYYTSAYFLDEALETIQVLKSRMTLDVYIEVSEFSKKSTVLNLDSIQHLDLLEDPLCVLGNFNWEFYRNYFDGINKVKFVIKRCKGISIKSLKTYIQIGKTLRSQSYDVIHFDNITESLIGIMPFLNQTKKYLTIHDSVNHYGEFNLKQYLLKKILYHQFNALHFFSKYTAFLFQKKFKYYKKIIDTPLLPYTIFNQFINEENCSREHVLFYGRISKYKGVDLLIEAIPLVLKVFPNQHFIIAGKMSENNTLDFSPITSLKNVTIINDFIDPFRLVYLIQSSKFLVCPYREASQSGVLMSCFALKRTLVASDVGSFSEYIDNAYNGLLCYPNATDIANKIIIALTNNYYLSLEKNIQAYSSSERLEKIGKTYLQLYSNFQ